MEYKYFEENCLFDFEGFLCDDFIIISISGACWEEDDPTPTKHYIICIRLFIIKQGILVIFVLINYFLVLSCSLLRSIVCMKYCIPDVFLPETFG